MGSQDNSLPLQAILDIETALNEMGIFKEVSGTPKSPEEVEVFPSAYFAGGDGAREAADVQHILFKQSIEYLIFLYVHEKETWGEIGSVEGLSQKIETLIKLTIDKMDSCTKGLFLNNGYLMEVVQRRTDGGALAMTGMPIAAAELTLLAQFPPKQAV